MCICMCACVCACVCVNMRACVCMNMYLSAIIQHLKICMACLTLMFRAILTLYRIKSHTHTHTHRHTHTAVDESRMWLVLTAVIVFMLCSKAFSPSQNLQTCPLSFPPSLLPSLPPSLSLSLSLSLPPAPQILSPLSVHECAHYRESELH